MYSSASCLAIGGFSPGLEGYRPEKIDEEFKKELWLKFLNFATVHTF